MPRFDPSRPACSCLGANVEVFQAEACQGGRQAGVIRPLVNDRSSNDVARASSPTAVSSKAPRIESRRRLGSLARAATPARLTRAEWSSSLSSR